MYKVTEKGEKENRRNIRKDNGQEFSKINIM